MDDFLSQYLRYTTDTESHKVYHRWSAITSIGALLGRHKYISFGHGKIYANFYCMLLGEPGARKSSAIKLIKKLLSSSGYETFSADRSSREKFLLDLSGYEDDEVSSLVKATKRGEDVTETQLWGSNSKREPAEVFIVADEFNEFVSAGNVDFYTTLGNLWDWDDEGRNFEDKVKNSKSVSIYQPTVSLLGGNTQENFARAFPPEILGHGFLSRLLLIHGIPSGRKIAFPTTPTQEATAAIIGRISSMQREAAQGAGELLVGAPARELLEKIYIEQTEVADPRFKGYNTRRYTHLLKLCIITASVMGVAIINREVVIYANTMLAAIEQKMPDAIGEFGKGRHSDVASKVLDILTHAMLPIPAKKLYIAVRKDIDNMRSMTEILNNLQFADRIQFVPLPGGKGGWLAKKEVSSEVKYVDWSLLSEEERNML